MKSKDGLRLGEGAELNLSGAKLVAKDDNAMHLSEDDGTLTGEGFAFRQGKISGSVSSITITFNEPGKPTQVHAEGRVKFKGVSLDMSFSNGIANGYTTCQINAFGTHQCP